MTGVVLTSSIDLAIARGAVAERTWRGAWYATCPPVLGRVGTLPCGSEGEALAEIGDMIRLHDARRARQGSAAS